MQRTLEQVLDGHHQLNDSVQRMLLYVQWIPSAARLCPDCRAIVVPSIHP